jgi:glycosyltransferase EpsE
MKDPKVSVVVAAYNLQHVIEKSLQSVLDQTFKDFEIVVCEDCSTDGTFEILRKMADKDDRIVLLRNEKNTGQAYARNRCFSEARGEYIAIHDGDDFSVPERLEKQTAFLDGHPEYAFVSGLMRTLDDSGNLSLRSKGHAGKVEKEDFLWGLPFCHPATMFRRDAIRKVGGYRVDPVTRFRNETMTWSCACMRWVSKDMC